MPIAVYHAGTEVIESPLCKYGRKNLDFGQGFYLTTIREQAKAWAARVADVRGKAGLINVYSLDRDKILAECRCKVFAAYDIEWLDFICRCRKGYDPSVDYDYVEGGVANDRVVDSINAFLLGFISKEETLRRLSYHEPTNQICLLSQTLTDRYLHYERSEHYE